MKVKGYIWTGHKRMGKLRIVQFIFASILLFGGSDSWAQNDFHLYSETANADSQIVAALAKAKAQHKYVFLEIGGNWCIWCKRFNTFSHEVRQVDSLFNADFIVEHINYSKENKNPSVMANLSYPQRFGFPVFVILNEKGERIHTQNSGYLEDNGGYGTDKVIEFLKMWSPSALKPEQYLK